jgi:hypothetical protein
MPEFPVIYQLFKYAGCKLILIGNDKLTMVWGEDGPRCRISGELPAIIIPPSLEKTSPRGGSPGFTFPSRFYTVVLSAS